MLGKDLQLNHIYDNEIKFKMRRLLDDINKVVRDHKVVQTDFMDPFERKVSESILNRYQEIGYTYDGGLKESERKCINIFPKYINAEDISSSAKSLKLEGSLEGLVHKDYLGAVMGLGITREKIGDILLYDNYAVIIVKNEIKEYIVLNYEKVGNTSILISEIDSKNLRNPVPNYIEIRKFVSSLRLDTFISAAYGFSRSESMKTIKSGHVKVNWEEIGKSDRLLEIRDVISIRGKGRTILQDIEGISKKGRFHITIRKLV